MASVAWGSRLVVRAGHMTVPMRSLRTVSLSGSGWAIPVLADLAGVEGLLASGPAGIPVVVDVTTEEGPLRVDVEVVATSAALMLRPPITRALRTAQAVSRSDQRRENVRGSVHLAVRGTILDPARPPGIQMARAGSRRPAEQGMLAALGPGADARADLTGTTSSVSAGGVGIALDGPAACAPGSVLYVEFSLPGAELAPAILTVIEQSDSCLRAGFLDISPIHRERLVRLVFTRHRAELADRG